MAQEIPIEVLKARELYEQQIAENNIQFIESNTISHRQEIEELWELGFIRVLDFFYSEHQGYWILRYADNDALDQSEYDTKRELLDQVMSMC